MENLKNYSFLIILLLFSTLTFSQEKSRFSYGVKTEVSFLYDLTYYGNEIAISVNYKKSEKWSYQISLGTFSKLNYYDYVRLDFKGNSNRYFFYPVYLESEYKISPKLKVKAGLGYYYLMYRFENKFDRYSFWHQAGAIEAFVIKTDFILPTSIHYQFHKNLNVYGGINLIHSKYFDLEEGAKNPRHIVHPMLKVGFEYTFKFKKEKTGE